jgi:hypothetical protein
MAVALLDSRPDARLDPARHPPPRPARRTDLVPLVRTRSRVDHASTDAPEPAWPGSDGRGEAADVRMLVVEPVDLLAQVQSWENTTAHQPGGVISRGTGQAFAVHATATVERPRLERCAWRRPGPRTWWRGRTAAPRPVRPACLNPGSCDHQGQTAPTSPVLVARDPRGWVLDVGRSGRAQRRDNPPRRHHLAHRRLWLDRSLGVPMVPHHRDAYRADQPRQPSADRPMASLGDLGGRSPSRPDPHTRPPSSNASDDRELLHKRAARVAGERTRRAIRRPSNRAPARQATVTLTNASSRGEPAARPIARARSEHGARIVA